MPKVKNPAGYKCVNCGYTILKAPKPPKECLVCGSSELKVITNKKAADILYRADEDI